MQNRPPKYGYGKGRSKMTTTAGDIVTLNVVGGLPDFEAPWRRGAAADYAEREAENGRDYEEAYNERKYAPSWWDDNEWKYAWEISKNYFPQKKRSTGIGMSKMLEISKQLTASQQAGGASAGGGGASAGGAVTGGGLSAMLAARRQAAGVTTSTSSAQSGEKYSLYIGFTKMVDISIDDIEISLGVQTEEYCHEEFTVSVPRGEDGGHKGYAYLNFYSIATAESMLSVLHGKLRLGHSVCSVSRSKKLEESIEERAS
jgi:hypothetical protein